MAEQQQSFTPGPWTVNPVHAQVECAELSRLGGLLPVAQMLWPTDERSEAETEANARLIAAAPDQYKALGNAHEFLHFYFTGPDAERNRSVEGIENMLAEAKVAARVAAAALASAQAAK